MAPSRHSILVKDKYCILYGTVQVDTLSYIALFGIFLMLKIAPLDTIFPCIGKEFTGGDIFRVHGSKVFRKTYSSATTCR
jgi:hypothetical protein